MTTTRELRDAHHARMTGRRRWRCRCGQVGVASTAWVALLELCAHDQIAHVEPAEKIRAAERMFAEASR